MLIKLSMLYINHTTKSKVQEFILSRPLAAFHCKGLSSTLQCQVRFSYRDSDDLVQSKFRGKLTRLKIANYNTVVDYL